MQAVRTERRRPTDTRWLQHLSLLSVLCLLFTSAVVSRHPATADLAQRLPGRFLAPPGSAVQDWLPVRVPVRTTITPDPTQQNLAPSIDARPIDAPKAAETTLAAAQPRPEWVQAHRKTALFSTPEADAPRETDIPQWSFLRIVESQPNWLKVTFRGDGANRTADTAWVPADDVGSVTQAPHFVTSVQDSRLWSSDAPNAESLATVPRLATVEVAGPERNGRVAVKVADPANADGRVAWMDWQEVAASRGPTDRDVPIAQAFSPFATTARLD